MTKYPTETQIRSAYRVAKERYALLGVDTDKALKTLNTVSLSLHCWQGDDVGGFENAGDELGGGIAATGNYPGKARTRRRAAPRSRPGLQPDPRHASAEPARHVCRNRRPPGRAQRAAPGAFRAWVGLGQGQPARPGLQPDPASRTPRPPAASRWPATTQASAISGSSTASPAARSASTLAASSARRASPTSGFPTATRTRRSIARRRAQLLEGLAGCKSSPRQIDPQYNLDAVEGKLFGLGAESYVVGSHEFYLGYAVANQMLLTLDAGHFHPTETIADKISAVLLYVDEVLLHVSRGVRWDSDHVVILQR